MQLSEENKNEFVATVWHYYASHGRHDLPWRVATTDGIFDAYRIMVSEVMLQQTQVARITERYPIFLSLFPTVQALAQAPLPEVLRAWQGLGYNRRAKYLWLAARQVVAGAWPDDLTSLPGVGINTAGAIQAYAWNRPAIFIETNIRTVFLHHFFPNEEEVSDSRIRELLVQTIDQQNPREFYWALMDYGSFLKTKVRNLSQSKHFRKQPAFQGSLRQLRGLVVRELGRESLCREELAARCSQDGRLDAVLTALCAEGLISNTNGVFHLG